MLGIQTPTFSLIPKGDPGSAEEALTLAHGYGVKPFPWQELSIRAMLAETTTLTWAATVFASCVARQNGKGTVILIRELAGLLLFDEKIFHTAHLAKTADDAYARLWDVFESNPELMTQVRRHSEATSRSFIELKSGARIDFVSRTVNSGRGLSIDLLVIDEAQEMTEKEFKALQYTQAAKHNSQMILFGTTPDPDANGTVFANYRKAAKKKKSDRLAWLEWSADVDDDLDSREVWAKCNPSYGYLIDEQTILDERTGQSDDDFACERLSMWTDSATQRVIPEALWNMQGSPTSQAFEDLALSIDVTNDRSRAVVALAGKRSDGHYHIEKYEARAGIGWIVDYVSNILEKNVIRAVVVDGKSQALSLLDQFKKAGIKLTITGEREMAIACSNFYDGIVEGHLWHTAQPEVDYAIGQVRKRPLLGGGAWGWNKKSAHSDITAVVALTLALYGSQNSKVKKPGGGPKKSPQRMITLT